MDRRPMRWETRYALSRAEGARRMVVGEVPSVDLLRRIVQVRMNVQETLGRYIIADTKTAFSRRTVALTQAAVDPLAEHWQKQQLVKTAMGSMWTDNDLVLPYGEQGALRMGSAGIAVSTRRHEDILEVL